MSAAGAHKLQVAYEKEEETRRRGSLNVLDASQLPRPRETKRIQITRSTSRTSTLKSRKSNVKIIRRTLHGFGKALGLPNDPVETTVISLDATKRRLVDLVGVGSYPKHIRASQTCVGGVGGGVGLDQRRHQFLNANRGTDRSVDMK
jgi:hypothetical protein